MFISSVVRAQDLEPRSYAVFPAGLHAAAFSYTYSTGNVITAFASPVQELDVKNNVFNVGYVQTFTLFGKLARVARVCHLGFWMVLLSSVELIPAARVQDSITAGLNLE